MAKLSKDINDAIAAENAIKAIKDAKELAAFIKGERREDLLDIAAYRLNALKQGEQPGPITQETSEFKGSGVEGTKGHITGNDIIKEIDKADEKKALDLDRQAAAQAAAAETAKQDAAGPRNYVTAEDVIKKMRSEGKKI